MRRGTRREAVGPESSAHPLHPSSSALPPQAVPDAMLLGQQARARGGRKRGTRREAVGPALSAHPPHPASSAFPPQGVRDTMLLWRQALARGEEQGDEKEGRRSGVVCSSAAGRSGRNVARAAAIQPTAPPGDRGNRDEGTAAQAPAPGNRGEEEGDASRRASRRSSRRTTISEEHVRARLYISRTEEMSKLSLEVMEPLK